MPDQLTVAVQRLPHGAGLPLPDYATKLSAGVDLVAAVEAATRLDAGCHAAVPTGIAVAIPPGFEGQVRPRSGLAAKHGITVLNSPGTIDADYRGEIKVVLINLSNQVFVIDRGMRVAQLIFAPVVRVHWNDVTSLDETERSRGGFGSTGLGVRVAE